MLIKKLSLFGTGFLQVSLVSAQTWLISRSVILGIFVIGFLISFVWTINVKKVAFGNWFDRIIYSVGAGSGAVVGLLIARLFAGNY